MGKPKYPKPFDGAISAFYEKDAPADVRKAIETTAKNNVLDKSFPEASQF